MIISCYKTFRTLTSISSSAMNITLQVVFATKSAWIPQKPAHLLSPWTELAPTISLQDNIIKLPYKRRSVNTKGNRLIGSTAQTHKYKSWKPCHRYISEISRIDMIIMPETK